MENKESLILTCKHYLACYPTEEERLNTFISYLDRNESSQLYNRKNFDGHITASVFILDESRNKLLMLHHKILDRWLQPGGHVDEEDKDLLAAAYRECKEETGIASSFLTLMQSNSEVPIPFDIDSHSIPANIKRNEAKHYHHDIRYLFAYNGSDEISIDANESQGFQWISLAELSMHEDFQLVVSKVRLLIENIY